MSIHTELSAPSTYFADEHIFQNQLKKSGFTPSKRWKQKKYKGN